MSEFRRATLGEDFGYTPGEQPPDGEGWVKLNTNESPLPPSPRVATAIATATAALNRYPSPLGEPLRSAIASHHGVDVEQVAVGNGADALIDACFAAFCEPGSSVVLTEPTYSLLEVAARIRAVAPVTVALPDGGAPPPEFAQTQAPLRFLVNPNSPTGTWLEPADLATLLAGAAGVTVIDEAYCDFAPRSCIPLLAANPSWLVLRTFSKAHGLAGLRVGYAVGAPGLIADLLAVGESYPVDRCAIAGATAALEDRDHHRALVDAVRTERARLGDALRARGWSVPPSQANFLCAQPPEAAGDVAARLRARRILVRSLRGGDGARLRITVGTAAENDALLDALW